MIHGLRLRADQRTEWAGAPVTDVHPCALGNRVSWSPLDRALWADFGANYPPSLADVGL